MNFHKKLLVAASLLLACIPADAARFPRGSSAATGATTFTDLKVGGGGFLTSLSISNDGTKVVKTDAGQTWKSTNADPVWRLLVTSSNVPTTATPWTPYEVVVAPSDSSKMYVIWGGRTWASTNGGATWAATAFPTVASGPGSATHSNQGWTRLTGKRIAVDPRNPLVVYVGYPQDGVYVSFDGGTTAAVVSSIPAAGQAGGEFKGYALAIDGSSTISNSRSSVVYALPYGSQVYKSTNGGSATPTFSATSSGPTTFNRMAIDNNNGKLYVVDNSVPVTDGTLWIYNGTSWSNPNPSDNAWHAVCADPATANKLAVVGDGGSIGISTDGGATVTNLGNNAPARVATDVPWLANTVEYYFSIADCMFDPSASNLLYVAQGIGVWKTNPVNSSYVYTSQTAGIENLVSQKVVSSPSFPNQPILSSWDRPVFRISSIGTYPSDLKPNNLTTNIVAGWGLDYVSGSPGSVVSLVNWASNIFTEFSGISSDGGQTWTRFPTAPAFALGTATANTTAGNSTITIGGGYPDVFVNGRTSLDLGALLTTTISAAAGTSVLTFTSVPANLAIGAFIQSLDHTNDISFRTVASKTATTVTLDSPLTFNIAAGERIIFYPNSPAPFDAQRQIASSTSTSITLASAVSSPGVLSGDVIQMAGAQGGSIAASTANNIIILPQNNSLYPFYTTDGGTTWHNVMICATYSGSTCSVAATGFNLNGSAIPDGSSQSGWGGAYYLNQRSVAADRVTANKFYLYNCRAATAGGGLYQSTDSGATWARVSGSTQFMGNAACGQGSSIKSVAGNAGHLFIQGGGDPANGTLARSCDGGATWSTLANIDLVSAMGFGAPKPGNSYPAVFFAGRLNGTTTGIFRSDNMPSSCASSSQTWIQLAADQFPAGYIDAINDMEGDASTYGMVYVARGSSGWAVGTLH